MDIKKVLKERRSYREFGTKKPSWRKILQAMDYARFAPMAGGKNVLNFVLVDDKKVIEKLAEASQQNFLERADYVVVAVSKDGDLGRSYGDRGSNFARQQAGAMIQNFLLGLTEKGLVTTWVGYFAEDLVRRALSIPEGCFVEGLFPIGKKPKRKLDDRKYPALENMIYFNKWKNKKMTPQTRVRAENV